MNPLTRRPRAPRPLRSVLVRVLVPRLVMFAAAVGVLLVGQVMAVNPSSAPFERVPNAVPTWSPADAAAHPECVSAAAWPEGKLGEAVVVYRFRDAATVKVPFAKAWDANHDASETNDLWVLGVCA